MNQATNNIFDIKSASLDLLALLPRTTDLGLLTKALTQRFGQRAALGGEAFVLDLEGLEHPTQLDLTLLLPILRQHGLRIIGLRHPDPSLAALAARHGLIYLDDIPRVEKPVAPSTPSPDLSTTMIIERPVRTGQQIYAQGKSLVVLAMVNAGAEIIADGDIHVYAPLRGRAIAGARGNTAARIFVRSMEAELVSIAGLFRPIDEKALPDSLRGKATQIYLNKESLVMTALGE